MLTLSISGVGLVTILAFQQVDEESAIALVYLDGEYHDRFVTWRLAKSEQFGWCAFNGHYFHGRLQAEMDYTARTNNYRIALPAAA